MGVVDKSQKVSRFESLLPRELETLPLSAPAGESGAAAAEAVEALLFDFAGSSKDRFVQSGPAEVKDLPIKQFPGARLFGKVEK